MGAWGMDDFARPQGRSFPPGRRPGPAGPHPRVLASEVVISAKSGGPSIHRGGCADAALRERKPESSALIVLGEKKVLLSPEDDAVKCPCGTRELVGRSPFVPSDRGSLDGGRASAEPCSQQS